VRPKPRSGDIESHDWLEIHRGMRRRIVSLMYRRDDALADDLAQEATIRLLRAMRREAPRELEKLMTTIASRTFADHLRRRQEQTIAPDDPLLENMAAEPAAPGWRHPLDLLDVVMRELFRAQDPQCLHLYRQWRVRREWRQVAENMKPPSTAEAVRQKYSRCLKRVLPKLRSDPRYARIAEYAESGEV